MRLNVSVDLEQLQELIDRELFEEAWDWIQDNEASFQNDSIYFYLKAYTCFRMEWMEEAIVAFQASIKLDPTNCAAYSDLGYLLLTQERWDEAEFFIKKVFSMNPHDPLGIERLGLLHYAMGELEEARESFLVLFKLGKGSPRIHNYLGEILHQLGEFEKALFYFDQCLKTSPEFFEANLGKAQVLEDMGKFLEAIDCYQKMIPNLEEEEDLIDVLMSLASCQYKMGQLERAHGTYRKVLQLIPDDPTVLNNMGLMYLESGRLDAAQSYLSQSLKIEETFEALFNLGRCHLQNSRLRLARSSFRGALKLASDMDEMSQSYYQLGRVLLELNKNSLAYENLKKSLDLKGDSVDIFLLYLESAHRCDRIQEALNILQKVRPKNINLFHSLFLFYMGRGEFEEALKTVNRGLKKFKDLAVLYYYRASIYSLMGKFKLAIRNLKSAVEGDAKYIQMARSNACFKSMVDTVEFEKLLCSNSNKH